MAGADGAAVSDGAESVAARPDAPGKHVEGVRGPDRVRGLPRRSEERPRGRGAHADALGEAQRQVRLVSPASAAACRTCRGPSRDPR